MNKNILLFNSNSLFLYSVGGVQKDGTVKAAKLFETEWNNEDLGKKLSELKASQKLKNVSILISDELAYIASLELKESLVERNERETIEGRINDVLPESIDNLVWDYKLIKKHNDLNVYQIIAVNRDFLKLIKSSLEKLEITIDLIEPIAYTLARLTSKEAEIHMLAYSGEFGIVLSVVYKGAVIFSITYKQEEDIVGLFSKFKKYAIDKYELDESIKVISNVTLGDEKVEVRKLSPLMGAVLKRKGLKGKDRDFLMIPVDTTPKDRKIEAINLNVKEAEDNLWAGDGSEDNDVDNDEKDAERKKLFGMIGILVVLIIIAVTLIMVKNKDKETIVKEDKTEKVEPIVIEDTKAAEVIDEIAAPDEATPEKELNVDFADYKILVKNGAGIAGEAGKVKTLLADNGFEEISVGNADSYDYQKTEIIFKEDIPKVVFDAVKDSIRDDYAIEFPIEVLSKDDEYDSVVIVGSLKAGEEEVVNEQ